MFAISCVVCWVSRRCVFAACSMHMHVSPQMSKNTRSALSPDQKRRQLLLPAFSAWSWIRPTTCDEQVGHAGTLDPLATGLLIVCTGQATKVVDTFQAMHKSYSGTRLIGDHAECKSPLHAGLDMHAAACLCQCMQSCLTWLWTRLSAAW